MSSETTTISPEILLDTRAWDRLEPYLIPPSAETAISTDIMLTTGLGPSTTSSLFLNGGSYMTAAQPLRGSRDIIRVRFSKIDERARTPTYGTSGAGAFDFFALDKDIVVPSGGSVVIRTGIIMAIPVGYVMLLFSRSGHGFKHDVRLSNCVGVIDADYRGEILIKLRKDTGWNSEEPPFKTYGAICQGIILPYPEVEFEEVGDIFDLGETERGTDGFGSTGG